MSSEVDLVAVLLGPNHNDVPIEIELDRSNQQRALRNMRAFKTCIRSNCFTEQRVCGQAPRCSAASGKCAARCALEMQKAAVSSAEKAGTCLLQCMDKIQPGNEWRA